MSNQLYNGIFFDKDIVQKLVCDLNLPTLEKPIESPHVTFNFKKEDFPDTIIGASAEVKIIGLGHNDENVGLLVDIPESLKELYNGNPNIHITTSISNTGKAINTGYLDFMMLSDSEQITLEGKLGYMDKSSSLIINGIGEELGKFDYAEQEEILEK